MRSRFTLGCSRHSTTSNASPPASQISLKCIPEGVLIFRWRFEHDTATETGSIKRCSKESSKEVGTAVELCDKQDLPNSFAQRPHKLPGPQIHTEAQLAR